ncbi:hypothetical protein N7517_005699 [Penicillium concentricum]|uniref:Uncharacterized protein n=1 Tax=Penicillium concentricum TaxID=293559 RepID=A0A9W9SCN4_9EURO|nr:uncharacterized protein N7517_005699 [Penicillium concentricum]KAJ5373693.1 hypothetical protein N7517_005699 [Penicillium concentricum]
MDHTTRDLFPALVIQLSREQSGTPSIQESNESLEAREAREYESPIPAGVVHPVASVHLTDGDNGPASPVPNQQIPSGSEYEASSSPPSPKSPRPIIRSHRITDQAPSTPVRPTRVRYFLGENSQKSLPAASPTGPSGNTASSVTTRNRQNTDTDSANAKGRPKNVTPITTPGLKIVVKKPYDATLDSRTDSKSANTKGRPKDVNPVTNTTTPRLKLVLKRPRKATPDSRTASDFTNANNPPNNATPNAPRRIRLVINKKPRQSIMGSNPPTVPLDPVSNEYPSSSANPGDQPSNIDSDQLKPTANTSVESSFVPGSHMDPPKSSTFSTSHRSSSEHDEASSSINPTSELPTTSASPRSRSSSGEAPFGYSGYRSPLRDYVFSTPPDPSTDPPRDPEPDPSMDHSTAPNMDPYQPYHPAVMSGITPFEDPNVLPSTFMYPDETPNNNWTTDPMGVYTPEEFERIIASEQEVLREMSDPHADPPHVYAWEEQQRMRSLAPDVLAAEMKAAIDEIEAANAGDESLQPGYWNSIGPPQPYPTEPDAPESSLTQHPPARLESDEPARTESSSAQDISPDPREMSEVPSQTLQSVEETYQASAVKHARHSSPKTKSSIPDLSTTASARTSISVQRRSTSSTVKTTSPPSTSTSTRRRSKNQPVTPAPASTSPRRSSRINKAELATPEAPITVSPRRLRSSDVNPSSSTKKFGKGNATPDSWETAPIADKMLSQMKETTTMSWVRITTAWNDNRAAEDDLMTWRALSKRWARIKEKIGVWPGFDHVLLDNLREFDSELDNDGFVQVAEFVSAELGWEIPAEVCQGRYEFLKSSGKLNLKGKGKARK